MAKPRASAASRTAGAEAINKAKARGEKLLTQAEGTTTGLGHHRRGLSLVRAGRPGGRGDPGRCRRLPGVPVRRPVRLLHRRRGRVRGGGARAVGAPRCSMRPASAGSWRARSPTSATSPCGPDSPFSASAASRCCPARGASSRCWWSSTNWSGSCPGRSAGTRTARRGHAPGRPGQPRARAGAQRARGLLLRGLGGGDGALHGRARRLVALRLVEGLPAPRQHAMGGFLPGAIMVGVGVEALHIFTVVWISRSFESKSEAFGAIGGSLSILLWSYVIGRIMAAAPVLNAAAWRRTHLEPVPAPLPPPSPAAPVSPPPPPAAVPPPSPSSRAPIAPPPT